LAASDFSSAFVKIAINVAMNNTRNDESPGQHHQCSVWFGKPQGTRHWTTDARIPFYTPKLQGSAVCCVLIFMAGTVQQNEQQTAAKSAAKARMEALKSCCIQLGAVQCTHTRAVARTHTHTHPLNLCHSSVNIRTRSSPTPIGKREPNPKPLSVYPSLMELPSPPAGQHFVCPLSLIQDPIPHPRILHPVPRISLVQPPQAGHPLRFDCEFF